MGRKQFLLGIDGLPYNLIQKFIGDYGMYNLKELLNRGSCKAINSVYPVISSVAWTSYATGQNPAYHNIFGFIDRQPRPFSIEIPTARQRRGKTIWQKLSEAGKKVIVMNVPLTYPPQKINGIMVSCFLSPNLDKASYPQEISQYLKDRHYILDVDANLARKDKMQFIIELIRIMKTRFQVCFELIENEEWDFTQLHIMETDRLFHFLWDELNDVSKNKYSPLIKEFFAVLDQNIGEMCRRLNNCSGITFLSDHGFCGIKYEVQMNLWLEELGLLKFNEGGQKGFRSLHEESICYSLLPGRFYINLEGREEKGVVKEEDYMDTCRMIKEKLLSMSDQDGNNVIDRVYFKDEIYSGPYLKDAADIIAHPVDGYDLKSGFGEPYVFSRGHLNGMHTYENATVFSTDLNLNDVYAITDISARLMEVMDG